MFLLPTPLSCLMLRKTRFTRNSFAQYRLNLKSNDFFFLSDDPSSMRIMKKIVVGKVIGASGYDNKGTMMVCRWKDAQNYAISLHGSMEAIDAWYTVRLERSKERVKVQEKTAKKKQKALRPKQTSKKSNSLVNLIKENQALNSRGMLWHFKSELGLVYLPRLPRMFSEIKVVVTELSLETARSLEGCEDALIATSNLFKGLLIATPLANRGGHQFAIVAVGVAMHCDLDRMYEELSPRDIEELKRRSVLFGDSKTIHTVNTRLIGFPDDSGYVPIIRSSGGDIFANHSEVRDTSIGIVSSATQTQFLTPYPLLPLPK